MTDHIHVGYRGGRFADNFDSIFRRVKPLCRDCRYFSAPSVCRYHEEVASPTDSCPCFEHHGYEGD